MMQNLFILSLCCVAIRASGEFSVLSSPKSISFKGNDVLQSQYVGDVLYAALGNPVPDGIQWAGMIVEDPFNMAKGVIALFVDGVEHINVNADAKTYAMTGSAAEESLNAVSAELEASYNAPVCDINFEQFDEAVNTYRACFGDLDVATKTSKNLNPSLHNADKVFLNAIAYIEAAAENLGKMAKASNFLVLRVPLGAVSKAHGEKSDAMAEAIKLIVSTASKLNAAVTKSNNNEAFVVAITNKSFGSRAKREVVPPSTNGKNQYNLAEYYNQDYPVIFNIILWFMVTFGLALLAICYAIGSMDPGRDSIIYRMTANRMKKDN